MTARGAIALSLISTLVGYVIADRLDLPLLVGVVFALASVVGVLLVNRRELLSVVVTPPLVFFVATLFVELGRSLGAPSVLQSLGAGMYGSLSNGAPWLFACSALVLGIAWRRGLRENVRELREDLRADREVPKPRKEPMYAPEPEGYFEPRLYGTARTED